MTQRSADTATDRPTGRRYGPAATMFVALTTIALVALWPNQASLYVPHAAKPDRTFAVALPTDPAPAAAVQPAFAKPPVSPWTAPRPLLLTPGAPPAKRRAEPRRTENPASKKERAQKREIAALRQQLASQRAQLASLLSAKTPMLRILDEQSRRGVEQAERVVALTGLDTEKLLAEQPRHANGGLLTVIRGFGLDRFDATAHSVARRVERWHRLQAVLRRLPLVAPLDHYRKTSNFGKRKDPKTKRTRNHNGTDFAYYRGAAVRATAAGKVVFAGRRGGFGNLVEIDHGQGIRTRYAHLHKRMVEKGDTVTFRQQIGQLGSTGRSTGPHVHYEILVRGRAVNPMRFITAGKYAFKPVPEAQVVAVRPEDEKRDGEAVKATLKAAQVDAKPKPRAAAALADRPDSSTRPGEPRRAARKAVRKKSRKASRKSRRHKSRRHARLSRSAKRRAKVRHRVRHKPRARKRYRRKRRVR